MIMLGLLMSLAANAAEKSLSLSGSAGADGAEGNVNVKDDSSELELYRPTHDKFNLHLGIGFVMGLGNDLANENPGYEDMGVQGLVGFDVVELCPATTNKSPDFLAAKLIYQILSYRFKKNQNE